jgi:hypothetical protein
MGGTHILLIANHTMFDVFLGMPEEDSIGIAAPDYATRRRPADRPRRADTSAGALTVRHLKEPPA